MHRLFLAAALALAPVAALGQTARDNIDALIEQQAKANGVPASFVHAVVKRESNYNPNAKGGSALGLMQIKHATARALGYTGNAAGLYDPETNLRFGVAYLAGAYRTAQGNLQRAYQYYNRGYYYAAKQQGVAPAVAAAVAPVAASASAMASLFGAAPAVDPAAGALAYASSATQVAAVPSESVEVPLPPRRPVALGGGAVVQLASLDAAAAVPVQEARADVPAAAAQASAQAAGPSVEVPLPPRRPEGLGTSLQVADAALSELRLSPPEAAAAPTSGQDAAQAAPQASEAVTVPLPPRRPSVQMLAAAAPRRPAAEPVREAVALPVQ